MTSATTCSETNQRIRQVMLSLQRLSQCVLPDMKRTTDDMQSIDLVRAAAASHDALMLETHKIVGAALKELGSIMKGHRPEDHVDEIKLAKKPLSFEIALEILRFCARVELDKLQLVSKAKRALVDEMSDHLALHKIYLAYASHDESGCAVLYHLQRPYSDTGTAVRDVLAPEQDNVPMGQALSQLSPFRRMRNAFVGAMRFELKGRMSSQFKALFSEFLHKEKGALKVGRVRLVKRLGEQWFNFLFVFATEEVHAECLVMDACKLHMDRLLSAVTIRRSVKRITIKASCTKISLGDAKISALAHLAMNAGDIRRIDFVLNRAIFSSCVGKWIEAMTREKSSSQMVNNALFHCRDDASMPATIEEPTARLPKRKWSGVNYRGQTCEMEDLHEKSVFVFENANVSKKITAVFARYLLQPAGFSPGTRATCNFIFDPSETADIGDFTDKHVKTIGASCYFE